MTPIRNFSLMLALTAAVLVAAVPAGAGTPATRENAVRAAKLYLQVDAFSFSGLVGQLRYAGFSPADATYGAGHAGANWTRQAATKAKAYLRLQPFSRSGLIGQLKHDGFTPAQALYGARAAGL